MTRSINQATKDWSWISTYHVLNCFLIIKRSHSDEDHEFNTYLTNFASRSLSLCNITVLSFLQYGTSTSSPTTDAFNRDYSSYASLTGVQLTRVVSPVNKRAPSNGERSQKANLPRRRLLEQVVRGSNFRRIRETSPNPPPASFTSLFPATHSRGMCEKKTKVLTCSLVVLLFRSRPVLFGLTGRTESGGTTANNRSHSDMIHI